MFHRTSYPFLLSLLLELQVLLLLTFESLCMPDPLMADRTEDNILWTRLTAVTAKGVYTVINIGHLSYLFLLHVSVAVLAGFCITYSRRLLLLSDIVLLSPPIFKLECLLQFSVQNSKIIPRMSL